MRIIHTGLGYCVAVVHARERVMLNDFVSQTVEEVARRSPVDRAVELEFIHEAVVVFDDLDCTRRRGNKLLFARLDRCRDGRLLNFGAAPVYDERLLRAMRAQNGYRLTVEAGIRYALVCRDELLIADTIPTAGWLIRRSQVNELAGTYSSQDGIRYTVQDYVDVAA
jgi:hypothetical protein